MYVDKLDETVIKYNRNYHSAIKVKPVYVKSNTYIDSNKGINNKYPKLKLVILLEYQNMKIFLQRLTCQIGFKKFL